MPDPKDLKRIDPSLAAESPHVEVTPQETPFAKKEREKKEKEEADKKARWDRDHAETLEKTEAQEKAQVMPWGVTKGTLPPASKAGSKPHLQPDATFTIIHPCQYGLTAGTTGVTREKFRPRADGDEGQMETLTNDVIERLIRLGAITCETG